MSYKKKEPDPVIDDPKRFLWKYVWGVTCPVCRGHQICLSWADSTLPPDDIRHYRCLSCSMCFETKLPQKLKPIGESKRGK